MEKDCEDDAERGKRCSKASKIICKKKSRETPMTFVNGDLFQERIITLTQENAELTEKSRVYSDVLSKLIPRLEEWESRKPKQGNAPTPSFVRDGQSLSTMIKSVLAVPKFTGGKIHNKSKYYLTKCRRRRRRHVTATRRRRVR
jgi:hypothetical protein